jgi:hypothetical protein
MPTNTWVIKLSSLHISINRSTNLPIDWLIGLVTNDFSFSIIFVFNVWYVIMFSKMNDIMFYYYHFKLWRYFIVSEIPISRPSRFTFVLKTVYTTVRALKCTMSPPIRCPLLKAGYMSHDLSQNMLMSNAGFWENFMCSGWGL